VSLSSYDIIYLLSNIFGTYVIFRFMRVFFDRKGTDKTREFFSYLLYFAIIGTVFIVFNTPILNLMSNIVLFFLLTLNYKAKYKRRIIAVICIYAILISVEAFTIILLDILKINDISRGLDLELVLSHLFSKIFSYIAVLALSNFKKLKQKINITPLHWFAIFIIPMSTLAATAVFMLKREQIKNLEMFLSVAFLFIVNIFIFYLYDTLLASYEEKMERNLLRLQNNAYVKQLDIIKQFRKNQSIFGHDIKHHLSILQALIKRGNNIEALDYLEDIFDAVENCYEYVETGNIEIDSIVNYKIQTAKNSGIEVDFKVRIPDKLNIHTYDIVTIIRNLFDNAINATMNLEDDRKIDININFDRNVLYININNPFTGELLYENGNLKSVHSKDDEEHGFGLESVKKSVEKYNGMIDINHEKNIFKVSILIYNS